jgi:peroxiredoxin
MMLKKTLFIGIFCLSFSALLAQKALPSIELKTLDGKTVNLKDFAKENQITVISVWATWCKPCHSELDAIAELYPDWKKKYKVELVAVTVDTQRDLSKVKPMVKTYGWEYTILSDVNQKLMQTLNFQTIPQTFLIDQKGNIVYTHSGYVAGVEYELEDEIKKLVK